MSLSGLDSALSGLRVAQRQLDVISGNVANVSTPGYTRKILPQQTAVIDGQTIGVRSSTIIRNVDLNLSRDLWTQVSRTNSLDVIGTTMSRIQEFHGASDKEISIASEIGRLRDTFVQLVNAPDDNLLLQQAVNQAGATATKINNFSNLLTQQRSETQDKIELSVRRANELLEQIASLNKEIKLNSAVGRSSAALEDLRDGAIRSLSEEIEISTFRRGDGVLVIQTAQGQQLADDTVTPLYFNPNPLNANSYYPANVTGLYVGGDPTTVRTAVDITQSGVGGKIGAYLELRDQILPRYQAQLDEMSYQMAARFEAQGVTLFVNRAGIVPANTAPIPDPPGPLTPVEYLGFAAEIRVNPNILADFTLLRNSTIPGMTVQSGSAEFLRRVAEFTFGEFEYLEARGTVDLRVSGIPDTLQNVFGINPQARFVGTVDIRTLSSGVDLNVAPGNPFLPVSGPPLLDEFTLRFDAGGANDTGDIVIDLTTVATLYPAPPATSGAQSLIDYLNNDIIPALAPPLDTAISAQFNQFGQLVINSQYDITIGEGTMGTAGLNYLGLQAGTTTAQPAYFDIQVGLDNPVRITVEPGDTEVELLGKLNAVTGVQASIDPLTGFLTIRPGPGFGGDIRLIDGPIFSTSNVSVVQELFGSSNPVIGVAHPTFRTANLGPGVNISTRITASTTILDYAQKTISAHTQDAISTDARAQDEKSYFDLLERQLSDQSGVNLDEELSNLILVQTAYAASAKAVTAIQEMFDRLLNAF
jgi:flagellar hook-associated protein 1 FlgK